MYFKKLTVFKTKYHWVCNQIEDFLLRDLGVKDPIESELFLLPDVGLGFSFIDFVLCLNEKKEKV